jgi:uncharacterized protein (TIGR01777 family)
MEVPAMKVAITGASGMIGTALVPFLKAAGDEVVRLVRRQPRGPDEARWDTPRGEIDRGALDGLDGVVHLAGANLAERRWTADRKALLRESRIGPTRLLAETLAGLPRPPSVLVSASAVGYYGEHGDVWLDEGREGAPDFLGRLVADWEGASEPAARAGVRVVRLRTGVVLSPAGGVLGRMLLPFKACVGGVLGPGTQYMSWIAIDDLLEVVRLALGSPALDGPVNAVAPTPVTNREFTKTLGRVLGRPTILPAPAFLLRLALGELADAALLVSTRVRPARLEKVGYRFRFPELEGALRHALGRPAGEEPATAGVRN